MISLKPIRQVLHELTLAAVHCAQSGSQRKEAANPVRLSLGSAVWP
jgi:hypothetical protein